MFYSNIFTLLKRNTTNFIQCKYIYLFICMCVHHMHTGACRGQKRHWIHWNWSCRWLTTMWVLGSNLGPQNSSSNLLRSAVHTIIFKMKHKAILGPRVAIAFGHRTDRWVTRQWWESESFSRKAYMQPETLLAHQLKAGIATMEIFNTEQFCGSELPGGSMLALR